MAPLVEAREVHKSYWLGEKEIHVLRGASFSLGGGEMASLVGPSGVGKSTFLHVIGTLDPPTAGSVFFDGRDAFSMSEEELAQFRNRSVGFVFQFHYLLPEFSALQNVAMPGLINRLPREKAEALAREMLEVVGLSHRLDHKPGELSGGACPDAEATAPARRRADRQPRRGDGRGHPSAARRAESAAGDRRHRGDAQPAAG